MVLMGLICLREVNVTSPPHPPRRAMPEVPASLVGIVRSVFLLCLFVLCLFLGRDNCMDRFTDRTDG